MPLENGLPLRLLPLHVGAYGNAGWRLINQRMEVYTTVEYGHWLPGLCTMCGHRRLHHIYGDSYNYSIPGNTMAASNSSRPFRERTAQAKLPPPLDGVRAGSTRTSTHCSDWLVPPPRLVAGRAVLRPSRWAAGEGHDS